MKPVAVEGMTISYGDSVPSNVELGDPSENVKADGKAVYAGYLTIKLSGVANASVHGAGGSGEGFFIPSSEKCTADGEALLLEGDKATIEVHGKNAETGVDVAWVVTATILDAGQSSVKAE